MFFHCSHFPIEALGTTCAALISPPKTSPGSPPGPPGTPPGTDSRANVSGKGGGYEQHLRQMHAESDLSLLSLPLPNSTPTVTPMLWLYTSPSAPLHSATAEPDASRSRGKPG